MSDAIIRQILEGRLKTWADARSPALKVAWQNKKFDPPSTTYLRAFLLPARTRSLDVAGKHRVYTGVFQVDIVTPANAGSADPGSITAELDTLFPVVNGDGGGRYTASGITVSVTLPITQGSALPGTGTSITPTYFQYRADVIT